MANKKQASLYHCVGCNRPAILELTNPTKLWVCHYCVLEVYNG